MTADSSAPCPPCPATVAELDEILSRPTPGTVSALNQLPGDFLILGVAGKMGPSLARMIRRACPNPGRRIIGVARFSNPDLQAQLNQGGVETIRSDLLQQADLTQWPDAPNVIFMVGRKFGSLGQESLTWATNTLLPARVGEKYRQSRILAFSTGNVYPMVPIHSGGSKETDPPDPCGEYGMSALGRERIFEYFSRTFGTPVTVLRLNYACELRYGVLVDIALKVFRNEPVDLAMGHLNTLWQGDANAMALQSLPLAASPPRFLNVTGLETLSVRALAEEFGRLLRKPVQTTGTEASTALLSNAQTAHRSFDPIQVPIAHLVQWIAQWISQGQPTLGKPTHFQVRDGRF